MDQWPHLVGVIPVAVVDTEPPKQSRRRRAIAADCWLVQGRVEVHIRTVRMACHSSRNNLIPEIGTATVLHRSPPVTPPGAES